MKLLTITIVYLTITGVLVSCDRSIHIDYKDIDEITFYCMGKRIERCNRVDLESLLFNSRDTVITNKTFIKEFVSEVNKLVPDHNGPRGDYRVAAFIPIAKDDTVKICFGESFGIEYNGVVMKDRRSIFKLIDTRIYATQPYDYWFDDYSRTLHKSIREMDETMSFINNRELRTLLLSYIETRYYWLSLTDISITDWYTSIIISNKYNKTFVQVFISPKIPFCEGHFSYIGATECQGRKTIVMAETQELIDSKGLSEQLAFEQIGKNEWDNHYLKTADASGWCQCIEVDSSGKFRLIKNDSLGTNH